MYTVEFYKDVNTQCEIGEYFTERAEKAKTDKNARINMNKIESRPVQGKAWEYRFFVDIEGNLNDAAVQNALRGLTEETIRLKILGNYVSAEGNE